MTVTASRVCTAGESGAGSPSATTESVIPRPVALMTSRSPEIRLRTHLHDHFQSLFDRFDLRFQKSSVASSCSIASRLCKLSTIKKATLSAYLV